MKVVNYALYGTIIALAAGLLLAYSVNSMTAVPQKNDLSTAAMMLGHVTLTQKDVNGNVIAYRQTDNVITNIGENCVAGYLFGVSSTGVNATCTAGGLGTDRFTTIAIGNITAPGPAKSNDEFLYRELPTGGQLARSQVLTPSFTEASGSGEQSFAQIILSKQFNNSGYASQPFSITESGIFNNTSVNVGKMFARQTFNPITLNTGESLTVQWTIQIGGTGSITTGEPTGPT